jgi:hypothetical protein
MVSIGDVEAGPLLLSVDLSQITDQPPAVIFGVYERRSKRHRLTIEQAVQLCEVLSSAVKLARSSGG